MPYSTPYRGTAGYRSRENDEGRGAPREMTARFAGVCADTGAKIAPGDLIQYDRTTKRTVLIKSNGAPAEGRYISNVFRTSGGTFYRNKRGTCEDAPCCGCCTI